MLDPDEEQRYNEAHKTLLELKEIGSMVDAIRTLLSRVRVTLDVREMMHYIEGDPLYDSANAIDHKISEFLDLAMSMGIDCSPARS